MVEQDGKQAGKRSSVSTLTVCTPTKTGQEQSAAHQWGLTVFCGQWHARYIPRIGAESTCKAGTNLCSPGDVAKCSPLKPKQAINQNSVRTSVLA